MKTKTVALSLDVFEWLNGLKVSPRESYNDILVKIRDGKIKVRR